LQLERVLKVLDTFDSLLYALRMACAGFAGRRLALAAVCSSMALASIRLSILLT
jgi:hypothetical protein